MRGQRILHPELAKAVATMGHQDILLVTDAGFPIPRDAWRIDLGFYAGLPDVLDILRALRQEIFVEEVHMAAEVETRNPRLYAALQDIYTGSGADFVATTHERLIAETAPRAKAIVRSGSLNPWANVALGLQHRPLRLVYRGQRHDDPAGLRRATATYRRGSDTNDVNRDSHCTVVHTR